MALDRVAQVANARRLVHKTMGVAATYQDGFMSAPVALTIGHFNKLSLDGNLGGEGYSNVLTNVDRVRFNREELTEKSVTLHRGGRLILTNPLLNGAVLVLDHEEPLSGPINVVWGVAMP